MKNDSWDLEDQSKKCRRAVNCLLASCICKAERKPIRNKRVDMPVHVDTDAVAVLSRPVTPELQTERHSQPCYWAQAAAATAGTASLNHTSDTVSQLYIKPRRIQSSWSKRILRTMITLVLLLASILKVEGNSDWRESVFKIHSFDCTTPTMINELHLPDECFIPRESLTEKLALAQPAWIHGE